MQRSARKTRIRQGCYALAVSIGALYALLLYTSCAPTKGGGLLFQASVPTGASPFRWGVKYGIGGWQTNVRLRMQNPPANSDSTQPHEFALEVRAVQEKRLMLLGLDSVALFTGGVLSSTDQSHSFPITSAPTDSVMQYWYHCCIPIAEIPDSVRVALYGNVVYLDTGQSQPLILDYILLPGRGWSSSWWTEVYEAPD